MFCHQFCYSVMSGLVHPGFTGGHSPLEGKGRAGWGRWVWQHSHRCSTPCRDPCGIRGAIHSGICWHDPHLAGISGMLGASWEIQNGARMKHMD